jgi:hypothetical protein
VLIDFHHLPYLHTGKFAGGTDLPAVMKQSAVFIIPLLNARSGFVEMPEVTNKNRPVCRRE